MKDAETAIVGFILLYLQEHGGSHLSLQLLLNREIAGTICSLW